MPPTANDGPRGSCSGRDTATSITLEQLSKAARRINSTRGVGPTLEAIAEEARSLVGAHQSVASLTIGHNWAQRNSAVSLSETYAAWRDYATPPDGSGIYSLVCETNRPMRLTQAELEAHPRWRRFGSEVEHHPPMRGWLAAPFVGRRGENIGLVQLSDKHDGADFTEHDENVLAQLAEIAAISVENARLYEAAQKARAESEHRLREAQAERTQLAEIFRNAPSFMCVLSGSEHVFERANDHFMALVGHRCLVGKPMAEALPEIEGQGFLELLDHVFHTGETFVGRDVSIVLAPPADQPKTEAYETRWIDFVYQPVRSVEGTVTGIYVQGVDLTDRKRVEQALRESEQRLKEINASLEERVAERTAELEERAAQLRALAAELTQAEQRERRRIGDILHDSLQQLLVAGRIQLSSLANGVTDEQAAQGISRVDDLLVQAIEESRSLTAGLIPPVLYDAGLTAALGALGRWMEAQQGLRVEVSASSLAEPGGEDLRALLFQSVRELLFNVVKHAGTDGAEVSLRRVDGIIEAAVADVGRGFDAKSALSNAQDRFGLFNMRERMAWLGGEMTIDSVPGKGTRVALRVPDDSGHGKEALAHTSDKGIGVVDDDSRHYTDEPPARTTTRTVVLADDHAIVRKGLVNALAGEPDITVLGEAANGQEAVEVVRRVRPDVVVLDVTMPGMSGIEAARAITTEHPGIRVVGLSVHESADLAEAMEKAGAVAYVNKAEASESLLAAIRGEKPI